MDILKFLHHIDKDVTLAINSCNSPVTDEIWKLFSDVQIWYVLYLAVAVFFFVRLGWKKALAVLLSCILCVVLCDQFANVIKHSVCRLRPCQDADMLARGLHILEDAGSRFGFFSAHAANTAGFAICSLSGFRNDSSRSYKVYGTAIFAWAVLVSISRVFVGKHFFGDVVVGFAIGLLFGWLCALLARAVIRRLC